MTTERGGLLVSLDTFERVDPAKKLEPGAAEVTDLVLLQLLLLPLLQGGATFLRQDALFLQPPAPLLQLLLPQPPRPLLLLQPLALLRR